MKKYKKYLVKVKATGFVEVWSRGEPDKTDVDTYDIEIADWENFDIVDFEEIVEGHKRYVKPIDWDKVHPIFKTYAESVLEQIYKESPAYMIHIPKKKKKVS